MQIERRGRQRQKSLSSRVPLRIAPSGVSCLLTINLYGGLLYGAASFVKFPWKFTIAPLFQPILVALLSFLTVFVDLSMGREAENISEVMQEVRHIHIDSMHARYLINTRSSAY